jgi:hypothetical protein
MSDLAPVYLLSLEVENTRSFGPRQRLDLSDGNGNPRMWTVLLGDNGVGKTTVLQVIAEARPRVPTGRVLKEIAAFPALFGHSIGSYDRAEFSGSSVELGMVGAAHPVSLGWETDDYGVAFSFVPSGFAESCFLLAYGASRRPSANDLKDPGTTDGTATLFDPAATLQNAEEWLLRLDYASLTEGRTGPSERRLEQVKTLLLDLLPGISSIDVAGPKEGVLFTTAYGTVPIGSLSLGYQTMIAWTVDLAYRMVERYPDADEPLAQPAIVLVDEIDLHLHPRWQRSIVQFLTDRFPKTQFVVTAHSPLIVQAAENANVVLLRRDGDHAVIDNNPARVAAWRVDQLLTSDLFGLDGPRSPRIEALLDEQERIAGKAKLTAKDKVRLLEIEAALGTLPTADDHDDEDAMDILRDAARHLRTTSRA